MQFARFKERLAERHAARWQYQAPRRECNNKLQRGLDFYVRQENIIHKADCEDAIALAEEIELIEVEVEAEEIDDDEEVLVSD